MKKFSRRVVAVSLSLAFLLSPLCRRAEAHNAIVHQQMTEFSYEMLRAVEAVLTNSFPQGMEVSERIKLVTEVRTPPAGVSAAEWEAFLNVLASAARKLRERSANLPPPKSATCGQNIRPDQFCSDPLLSDPTRPADGWSSGKLGDVRFAVVQSYKTGSDCGVWPDWSPPTRFSSLNGCSLPGGGRKDHRDHTGTVLGLYALSIDDEIDDTHLWIRPTSVLGSSAVKEIADKAITGGAGIAFIALSCAVNCVGEFLGFDDADCGDCVDRAIDLGKKVPTPSDIEGLIPGVFDIKGGDYVTMWHFINMTPGVSNEFDDRQGLFYEEAGLDAVPGALDVAILAGTDFAGMSFNFGKSQGIHRYQIQNGNDGHPDTKMRGRADWQKYVVARTPLSPIDNLGFFGWRSFRDNPNQTEFLGWPLHALGDASSPLHVIASTGYGHRPFEDAQERLWPRISDDLGADLKPLLQRAFEWRRFVLAWRARGGPERAKDLPLRDMVTALAQQTYDYSRQQQPGSGWPFNDTLSSLYLVDENLATDGYANRADAVTLVQPLVRNCVGAKMAFLASAMEVLP